jgi:UDP-glucose 4-epimerase
VSKLASELYVRVFADLYALRAAILRPFSAYGPRQRKQVVYDLLSRIREDADALTVRGHGTEQRSFTHAGSIVDALLTVADRAPLGGEVYNVVDDEPVTIAELVGMLCELMGVAPRVVYGVGRPGDVQRLDGDTARLRALGWSPGLNLRDGLAQTVAWFREEMPA